MSNPKWLDKYLKTKPDVTQIFNDLDAWLNYCRFNLIKYDPADLYKSYEYKEWQERRRRRQQRRNKENNQNFQNNKPRKPNA